MIIQVYGQNDQSYLPITSYWSARKTFANAVVKAFSNGYRLQYDKEFQQKVLENNKRKIKFEMY